VLRKVAIAQEARRDVAPPVGVAAPAGPAGESPGL
jgi:hypothetical protein